MALAPTVHVSRDRYHLAWDPAIPPIASVSSGSVVEFDTLDASGGQLTASSTVADIATLDFTRVDQVNGPVAVEGAEPGDTLQIELLEFAPAEWGWTASIPGFGLLADEFPDPIYRVTRIPRPGERAEFLPGARVAVAPFCGEVGVAPASGPLSTIPPNVHGGNMDTRHLTAGSTLFLPVFHPGALLSMGDGHAAQGDGEVCGTAVETPMRAVVCVTVRKDLHVTAPEFLTAAARTVATAGSSSSCLASGSTRRGRGSRASASRSACGATGASSPRGGAGRSAASSRTAPYRPRAAGAAGATARSPEPTGKRRNRPRGPGGSFLLTTARVSRPVPGWRARVGAAGGWRARRRPR